MDRLKILSVDLNVDVVTILITSKKEFINDNNLYCNRIDGLLFDVGRDERVSKLA